MDVEGLLSGRLLNNRLLINGNFGYRDNSTNPNGNFIGDFDLQWLLTPSGKRKPEGIQQNQRPLLHQIVADHSRCRNPD